MEFDKKEIVSPAKAGIQGMSRWTWLWIPAFAGMTSSNCEVT
jgi:hypothetical protein